MQSAEAQAHIHEDDLFDGGLALRLDDVDRLLLDSARASRSGSTPVRAWRDDLAEALAVLGYAESVLAGDAALLRHCLTTGPLDHKEVLDRMARAIAGGTGPVSTVVEMPNDEAVFARAEELLALHERMASADLTRREGMRRLLADIESQLQEITARRLQLEARLDSIRAAVIREYRAGHVPTPESWIR